MSRISSRKDDLVALQGYVRVKYIALLTAISTPAVRNWSVPSLAISHAHYYKWTDVLDYIGAPAAKALDLPATAQEAVGRGRSAAKTEIPEFKIAVAMRDRSLCKAMHPDGLGECAKSFGHVGPHQLVRIEEGTRKEGPEWKVISVEETAKANPHMAHNFDQESKKIAEDAAGIPHEGKRRKKKVIFAPGEIVTETPELAAYEGLPHTHPASKFLGKPIRRPQKFIDALPDFSEGLPSPSMILRRKWRANRDIHDPDKLPDWWQGEYVRVDNELYVRWSKLIIMREVPSNEIADFESIDTSEYRALEPNDPLAPPLPDDPPSGVSGLVSSNGAAAPMLDTSIPVTQRPQQYFNGVPVDFAGQSPSSLMICRRCRHSGEHHDEYGCNFAKGTVAACDCTQGAPERAQTTP